MAAGEDQRQPLVGDHLVLLLLRERLQLLQLPPQRPVAADPVDRAVARGRHDPPGGIRRDAAGRPLVERDHVRVLQRVLGELEVAEDADQGREDAAVLLAEDGLDYAPASGKTITGRTSIEPCAADGILAAHSSASSSESTSIR